MIDFFKFGLVSDSRFWLRTSDNILLCLSLSENVSLNHIESCQCSHPWMRIRSETITRSVIWFVCLHLGRIKKRYFEFYHHGGGWSNNSWMFLSIQFNALSTKPNVCRGKYFASGWSTGTTLKPTGLTQVDFANQHFLSAVSVYTNNRHQIFFVLLTLFGGGLWTSNFASPWISQQLQMLEYWNLFRICTEIICNRISRYNLLKWSNYAIMTSQFS